MTTHPTTTVHDCRPPATAAVLPVVGVDEQVPLLGGGTCSYANLDVAASAPCLQQVADTVADLLPRYASVHRGAGYASQVSTAAYEHARSQVAAFVGARSDDVAVFCRNTTDALALLAGCVPGRVVHLDVEHHANLLPWRDLDAHVVTAATTWAETRVLLAAALAEGRPALLSVTGASNVTGEVVPLDDVVALARRTGTRVVVDAAQLAPHRRIDLATSGVDYVAWSGHKLYAPFGAGALVGRRDWLDAGTPHQPGGGAVAQVDVAGGHVETVWAPAPARHEGGSPNVVGAVALATACTAVAAVGEEALAAHETALRQRLLDGLEGLPGVEVLRIWDDELDVLGVVSFTVPGDPGLVAAALAAEHGVGVRDGRFCAHPLLARLGHADGALRASIGGSTTAEHVDRLLEGLVAILADGPGHAYHLVDGRWAPRDDDRPWPEHLTGGPVSRPTGGCAPVS